MRNGTANIDKRNRIQETSIPATALPLITLLSLIEPMALRACVLGWTGRHVEGNGLGKP